MNLKKIKRSVRVRPSKLAVFRLGFVRESNTTAAVLCSSLCLRVGIDTSEEELRFPGVFCSKERRLSRSLLQYNG